MTFEHCTDHFAATFYSPPDVSDSDLPSIDHIPALDVVREAIGCHVLFDSVSRFFKLKMRFSAAEASLFILASTPFFRLQQ